MSHICKSGDETEIYDDGCELLPDMEKMADRKEGEKAARKEEKKAKKTK